jgi:23S rRNA (adenine2503-C2)-methyltransferase
VIDLPTLERTMEELGQPPYRARQVYEALTRRLATGFAEMSELPRSLREELAGRLRPCLLDEVEMRVSQRGGAVKALLRAADAEPVEAVLMTYRRRVTVCVSTQVGCAVRCPFCASGAAGLRRSLSAEEMVDQVLHFMRRSQSLGRRVTNVVFMGMGEPFHNYEETLRACRLLNDASGIGLAARSLSVSTAGVVPGIDRLAREPLQVNLAVSLHAATDELRDRLVPLNRTYPLAGLLAACARYVGRTRRKVMFEYVVLPGVNDGSEQVDGLVCLLKRPLYHLNLIAYNETGGEFARPSVRELTALRAALERRGLSCTVRDSPGGEIDAACGQLALPQAGLSSPSDPPP